MCRKEYFLDVSEMWDECEYEMRMWSMNLLSIYCIQARGEDNQKKVHKRKTEMEFRTVLSDSAPFTRPKFSPKSFLYL